MEQPPVVNIALREIVATMVNLAIDMENNEDRKNKLIRAKENALEGYNRVTDQGSDIFGSKFKNTTVTLIDSSDGVARCGNCHWEAHGDRCLNCGTRFRLPRDDDYYDTDDDDSDDQEQFTVNGIGDGIDSEDSFVVYTDEENEHGMGESEQDAIVLNEYDDDDFHSVNSSVDSVQFEGFSDTDPDLHFQNHHHLHNRHHNLQGDDSMWPEEASGRNNSLSSLARAVEYFHNQSELLETGSRESP